MSAPKIQCDYDQLAQIISTFAQQGDRTSALIRQMQQKLEVLVGGGWLGVGAERFYGEMGDLLLPAMGRLQNALYEASRYTSQIGDVLGKSEEEAASLFTGAGAADESGVPAGFAPSTFTPAGFAPSSFIPATPPTPAAPAPSGFLDRVREALFGNKYYKAGGATPTSHWERNTAYEEIIASVATLPGEAGQVRFFQAAERVTSVRMLGGTSFTPDFVMSESTFAFSNKVGEDLYTFNKGQANRLHADPYNLYDPNGTGRRMGSALEFDVNYVHAEQSRVESWIRTERSAGRLHTDNVTELSDAINGDSPSSTARHLFYKGVSPVADSGASDWARSLVGTRLDFGNQSHREAIGKATVFQAHGYSQAQYETYMRTGKLP